MKINKSQLKALIKEEFSNARSENTLEENDDNTDSILGRITKTIANMDSASLGHVLMAVDQAKIGNINPVAEGVENITPENIQIALDAIKQVAINFSPAIAAAALGLAYADIKTNKSAANVEASPHAPPMPGEEQY